MDSGKTPANLTSSRLLLSVGPAHSEVIPDSEEERQRDVLPHTVLRKVVEVIEISSDESQSEDEVNFRTALKKSYQTPKKAGTKHGQLMRRIIESSSDESDPEVIELSDSSSPRTPVKPGQMGLQVGSGSPPSPAHLVVDESIIILDEPKSARTPLHIGRKAAAPSHVTKSNGIQSKANDLIDFRTPVSTPNSSKKKAPPSQARPRPNSKKAMLEADLKRRREYAQQLFSDLNELVFKRGLPSDTQLNWNKRLLSTAGRARFHRSREGVQTTEIELAEKILDCDERIRNTLSHEMCHLATWVIDKKVDEHHGKLFKYWASLVMKKRPDIHVSIKHDYEISYPFEWKCGKCGKIYGRFSKSIRPDECVCGACKEGALIPLFSTRTPSKKTTKLSKLAPAKPPDSPFSQNTPSKSSALDSDGSGSEIEVVTKMLAAANIGDNGDAC